MHGLLQAGIRHCVFRSVLQSITASNTWLTSTAMRRRVVDEHGAKNWTIVADEFNTRMRNPDNAGRTGKQCRERWIHHLRPDIKRGIWTEEEDQAIVDGHKRFGNRQAAGHARCTG